MKAKVIRLKVYPCYLIIVIGNKGKISTALDRIGMKYTDHERDVEFEFNKRDGAFVLEMHHRHRPTPAQRKLGWKLGHTVLMWFPCMIHDRTDVGNVAHECIHLKNLILKYIGQKHLSLHDDELEANVYDFLFKKVYDALKPIRRRK